MSTLRAWLCLILVAAAPTAVAAAGTPERYIVRYAPGAAQTVRATLVSRGGVVHRALPGRRLLAASLPAAALTAIRARADVQLLEVDPKRYLLAEQVPYGLVMVQAGPGGLAEMPGHSRKICVMDTGYDLGHEDLPSSGALVSGDDGHPSGCSGSGCSADTGSWYEDGHGHGTHVSGTIVALGGNELGVVGVNPGGQLALHMVKVFDDQGGWAYGSDIIAAVDQCIDAGAHIISMSLGGTGSSVAEQAAFDQAYAQGILPIAAAGNGASASLSYPASYAAVVSVAAIDSDRALAAFSQFNHQVELAAPGVSVLSTLPGNAYAAWNGTSMATPHVSGVAALLWGRHEHCTAAEIRTALIAGAEDLGGPGRDSSYGYGLARAADSDALLQFGCSVLPPAPFVATAMENDVPVQIPAGSQGDEFRFTIEVPAGATDLRLMIAGGTGDADLYVRHGNNASADLWDCRPYINGNSETCVDDHPAPGTWHLMVRGYLDFTGVELTARYVEPDGSGTLWYFFPDADLPVAGAVYGTHGDLAFNDGFLQQVVEVSSGGNPSRRTSIAEHRWRIPDVVGGPSVTLQLVTAGTNNAENDHFAFDVSTDGGATWVEVLEVPLGGAMHTYRIPLAPTTSGMVLVRARDTDRTPRNLDYDRLYLDQLNIVTLVDANETPPAAPSGLSATAPSATRVSLQWTDNADNELGFQIRRWRLDASGDMEVIGQAPMNATSWLDDGVVPAASYRYQVAAYTASYTAESNHADVTTPDGILLVAAGEKQKGRIVVTLSWSNAGTVAVQRSVDGQSFAEIAVASDGTYIDDTGLKGSPVLSYRVCSTGGACSNTAVVSF